MYTKGIAFFSLTVSKVGLQFGTPTPSKAVYGVLLTSAVSGHTGVSSRMADFCLVLGPSWATGILSRQARCPESGPVLSLLNVMGALEHPSQL